MLGLSVPSASKLPLPSIKPSNRSRQNLPLSSSPPNPNSEPLNHRLIHQLNVGHLYKAISTLDLMAQKGIHPDLTTYSLLLKSCIRSRNFQLGKLVHTRLTHSQLHLNSFILNSLISLYSKSGDWAKAKSIFDNMGDMRDLVSWSAMVSCFANNDLEYEAIVTFLDMLENGLYPNEYCSAAVIRACSNAENISIGKMIFGFVVKSSYFGSDVCVGCALIDMFATGGGDLDLAYKVFEKMPEKNAVTWTLMITRFMQFGYTREAVDMFLDIVLSEYVPDRFTLSGVISACAELELLVGKQLHSWVIRTGMAIDVCLGCCLVDMYAKCAAHGFVDDSRKVFDLMVDHNFMSWTAIIAGYVQSGGRDEEAACANLSDPRMGEQVYTHAVKLGRLASVNCVGNSLISMYARSGMMEDAHKAFDMLFEKNLISYNTIVDAYAKNLNSEKAFEFLHEIEDTGIGASAFTFASLLSGAASIGAVGKGEQIHARVLKSGFESNQCICNALISMYARCGNIEAAFQVFNYMGGRNVISWTSMITGFAKLGSAPKAMGMFHKMLEDGLLGQGEDSLPIALLLVHETCSTDEVNHQCPPSSCGNILNISYPFRLKSDPETCGDLRYSLSFENNLTVLYLFEGQSKYYVQEINYNNYTIRIVDSGIQKDNYSSTPTYSLNHYKFSSFTSVYTTYQPKRTKTNYIKHKLSRSAVFLSCDCETPVNSLFYLDSSTCIDNGDQYASSNSSKDNGDQYSSNTSISHSKSKRYRYVRVGTTTATDVGDSCKVEQMFLTSWPGNEDPNNISCTDVHNELIYGFELSWLQDNCPSYCRGDNSICFIDDDNHVQNLYFSRGK
ncbi:pentatricopeptide repeat-containing protein At3g49170, chloroplastic-like [Fagus crenata]